MEEQKSKLEKFTSIFSKASGSISLIKDACKKGLEIRDQDKNIEHRNIYIELQKKIDEVLSNMSDLRAIYSDLRISYSDLKNAYAEKEREISNLHNNLDSINNYESFEVTSGCFVMRIKPTHQADGKPRYICHNCVQNHKVSILQTRKQGKGEWLECHACKLSLEIKPNGSSYHFSR